MPNVETYLLGQILAQWLDSDCLCNHISSLLQCPHPCVKRICQKLEKALMNFVRDEMFEDMFIEDIANIILSCFDPDINCDDDYCPEIRKIQKHMNKSPFSPVFETCSDSD